MEDTVNTEKVGWAKHRGPAKMTRAIYVATLIFFRAMPVKTSLIARRLVALKFRNDSRISFGLIAPGLLVAPSGRRSFADSFMPIFLQITWCFVRLLNLQMCCQGFIATNIG